MPFNVIDFFCGCGGTSAGLRAAGMNIVAGIDFDSKAIETYKLNFPEAMPLQRDVRSISEGDIEQLLESCRATGPLVFQLVRLANPFQHRTGISQQMTNAYAFWTSCIASSKSSCPTIFCWKMYQACKKSWTVLSPSS